MNRSQYVLLTREKESGCILSNDRDVIDSGRILKNSKFKIDEVSVSNRDFSKSYFFLSNSKIGTIHYYFYSDQKLFKWRDGSLVKESQMRRGGVLLPFTFNVWTDAPGYFYFMVVDHFFSSKFFERKMYTTFVGF